MGRGEGRFRLVGKRCRFARPARRVRRGAQVHRLPVGQGGQRVEPRARPLQVSGRRHRGAPSTGDPKDELLGEDVRQHRRTMGITRTAVAVLVTLLTVAIASAIVAYVQRDTARSRQFGCAVGSGTRPGVSTLSLLLALEALRVRDTPRGTGARCSAALKLPLKWSGSSLSAQRGYCDVAQSRRRAGTGFNLGARFSCPGG